MPSGVGLHAREQQRAALLVLCSRPVELCPMHLEPRAAWPTGTKSSEFSRTAHSESEVGPHPSGHLLGDGDLMGCDPVLVKALLEKLKGKNAVALLTAPAARQGRRTDLAAATSRRRGEKLRTSRTGTRLRKISGVPEIKVAHERDLVGWMNAESLTKYAEEHPRVRRTHEHPV